MKSPRIFALLSLAVTTLAPFPLAAADIAADMLREARAALQRGELDAAKAKLETVRSIDPKNPSAVAMLKQIQLQQMERGGAGTEAAMARLILPKVEFKEAQFNAVLMALRQQAERLTAGKVVPNFVAQFTEEQANTAVTLSLSNIPMTEVLKYLGTLTNTTFTYDKYAILVRPAMGAKPETVPVEAAK